MNAPDKGARRFAGVSYEEALKRARDLVPALRERAARAEEARVMPAETIADLHASGLLRTLQPGRWGGMEYDFIAYVDFPLELARGCASTGWNFANLQVHHWMLALYDERAQEEVWGADPDALIASGIAFPQGRGRKADGGFVIGGKWNFSSCVNVADWNMLAATVRDGERVVDHRMCLLHKSQYQIVDDWQLVVGIHNNGVRRTRQTRKVDVTSKIARNGTGHAEHHGTGRVDNVVARTEVRPEALAAERHGIIVPWAALDGALHPHHTT